MDRKFLWILLIVNTIGTIYGYLWYADQIKFTLLHYPLVLLPFIPDSPTASLFFTIALVFLLRSLKFQEFSHIRLKYIRECTEAFAVITLCKYGIWAVVMIVAGAQLGDPISWQEWMLIGSHLGMALQGLLYARFFTYGLSAIFLVGVWSLTNDVVDYGVGVYPWLPNVLQSYISEIAIFTILLGLLSVLLSYLIMKFRS